MTENEPSKAWYLFPIILWWIGGLIAFFSLRNRDRRMAYKTLLLGIIITVLFLILVMSAGQEPGEQATTGRTQPETSLNDDGISKTTFLSTSDDFWTVNQPLSNAQIKKSAFHMPYDILMQYEHDGEIRSYEPRYRDGECVFKGTNVCDRFVGNLIYNSGSLYSYHDHWGNDETVVVKLGLTDNTCVESNAAYLFMFHLMRKEDGWRMKKTQWDKLDIEDENCHTDERNIGFYGTHIGFYGGEYTTPRPLIHAHIIEPAIIEKKPISSTTQHYTISADILPSYVDSYIVANGMIGAAEEWNKGNTVKFTFVKSNVDADVNIEWGRGGAGMTLGRHGAQVQDDGTKINHRIQINLGGEDCSSNYQQFASSSLKHTIAHELGHYLGLRHITDPTHLMHPGGLALDAISKSTYDNLGHAIPSIDRPNVNTIKGQSLQSEITSAYSKLDTLNNNNKAYNNAVQQIENLEAEYKCQGGRN